MGFTLTGTRSNPAVASAGNPPAFAADLSGISDFFAARSFRSFATVAAMVASTGSGADEWAKCDNALGALYYSDGTRWHLGNIPVVANATARGALFSGTCQPDTGSTVFQVDVLQQLTYNGSAWIANAGAVSKVKPSSAVATGGSASVSTVGRVTFTAVNAVNLLAAFATASPLFDKFDVYFDISATSGSPFISAVLGNGGTPVVTTNYDSNYNFRATTTNSPANAAAAASWTLSAGGAAGIKHIRLHLENPNIAAPTTGKITGEEYTTAAVPYSLDGELGHRLSTAYADLQLVCSTGTMTGTADVVGISNS
jgi:hypothetical protein